MKTRVNTLFVISGDCLIPDKLTLILGITPSSFVVKGQIREYRRPSALTGEWVLETGWVNVGNLDDGVVSLMEMLWSKREKIIKFVSEQNVQINIISVVEMIDNRPDLSLSRNMIKKMAELDAEYSIDFYDYRSET